MSEGRKILAGRSRRQSERNIFLRNKTKKSRMSRERQGLATRSQEVGRLVWAKIPGSRTWPGIVISHVDCGMEPPDDRNLWIFWFGDNRISLGQASKAWDFVSSFGTFSSLRNAPATFKRGLWDILKECRKRGNLPSSNHEFHDLMRWAQDGFQNSSQSDNVFLPKGLPLPEKVRSQIDLIRKDRLELAGGFGGRRKTANDRFPTCSSSSDSDSDTEERRKWRDKAILLQKVRCGTEFLDSLCICCDKGENTPVVAAHPLFQGGMCQECKAEYDRCQSIMGKEESCHMCSICCSPGEVVVCDNELCDKVYCVACIELMVSPMSVDKIKKTDPWLCFLCSEFDHATHGLLVPRAEWVNVKKSRLHLSVGETETEDDSSLDPVDDIIHIPTQTKKRIRVLSLFDGIGTGLLVLEGLGLEVECYFASEVDADAVNVSKMNFGSKITHLGDIEKCSDKQIASLCPIDLLLGGSPCNDFSFVNPKRKGLYDPSGKGILFFHFYRVQKVLQGGNGGHRPLLWLFENVAAMNSDIRRQISLFLQRTPVLMDAKHFTAQKRARMYWGNIPGMKEPLPPSASSTHHSFSDTVMKECGREAQVEKLNCVTSNPHSLLLNRGLLSPVIMGGRPDVPWITEIEKVFGFPSHYTDVGNLGVRERQSLLGRAWSVPVVRHILSPLSKMFLKKGEQYVIE